MAVMDWSPLANLGKNFVSGYEAGNKINAGNLLAEEMGKANPDYRKASAYAFQGGDSGSAIGLLGLAQKDKDRQAERAFLGSLTGLGGVGTVPSQSAAPPASAPAAPPVTPPSPSASADAAGIPDGVARQMGWYKPALGTGNPNAYTPGGSFSRLTDLHQGMTRQAVAMRDGGTQVAGAQPDLAPAQPVQVADASGAAANPADLPAPDASPTQGFVVPGSDGSPTFTSPRLQQLERTYLGAPTDRAREVVKMLIDREREQIKTRLEAERGPAAVQEFVWARRNGMTKAKTPAEYEQEKKGDKETIPAGYRAIRDEKGGIGRLEAIPGGEAARKQEAADKKTVLQQQQSQETGSSVANAIDDIDRLMAGAWLPVTGGVGSRIAGISGTAAHDVSNALSTVKANVSFDKINQMRQASPTGGALGNVTEGEHKLLSSSIAALEQSQSESQFKTNLGRVRAAFERSVHGRALSAKERKSGGPMTMDRAKGLRDEAAAAIAGGAPKDQVLKRLKDTYGIDGSGL